MINSVNTSPSFKGIATVKFKGSQLKNFSEQLERVARSMNKKIIIHQKPVGSVVSDAELEKLERSVGSDQIMVADIVPATKRGDNYRATIISGDTSAYLKKMLVGVFDRNGNKNNVAVYELK